MGTAHTRAWVSTLVVDASLVGRAVGVDCALMLAFNVRIALKTRKTDAGSGLVPFSTLCIDSTSLKGTWVEAFPVEASLVIGTFIVTLASSCEKHTNRKCFTILSLIHTKMKPV